MKSGSLKLLEPSGPVQGLVYVFNGECDYVHATARNKDWREHHTTWLGSTGPQIQTSSYKNL
jgi:hypothetical protein